MVCSWVFSSTDIVFFTQFTVPLVIRFGELTNIITYVGSNTSF